MMTKEEIAAAVTTLIEINPVVVTARNREITMGRNSNLSLLQFEQGGGGKLGIDTTLLSTDTGIDDAEGMWATGQELVLADETQPYYITQVQRGELDAYVTINATQLPPSTE